MAITNTPQSTSLKIKVQTGVSTTGSPVYVYRSYTVKPGASDADLHFTGMAIASLQRHSVSAIQRVNTGNLINM